MKQTYTKALALALLTALPVNDIRSKELSENEKYLENKEVSENIIVVSASRFEQNKTPSQNHITIIDKDDITKSNVNNLVQVLRKVPGIQISIISGKAIISLRGMSAEQAANNVLIQIDGLRINNTDIAAPDLESIDLSNVERIEVSQGGSSSLYGDQAVAGLINIITKTPNSNESTVSVSLGNYDTQQVSLNLNKQQNDQWSWALMANYRDSDNFREHNSQEQKQLSAKLNYHQAGDNWLLEVRSHQEDLQTPGALLLDDLNNPSQSREEFSNDYVNTDTDSFRLSGQHEFTEYWKLAIDINHSSSDIESINSFIGFATDSINTTDRKQTSIYPRIKYSWDLDAGNAELVAGSDLDQNDYDFSLLSRSNEQRMSSIYSQLRLDLSQVINLELAGRYAKVRDRLIDRAAFPDGVKIESSANAFDIGLNFALTDQVQAYTRFSKNYRFAKVDEQSYTSIGVIGLKPQTGRSVDLGLQTLWGRYQLDLAAYRLTLQDEIFYDVSAPSPENAFFPGANVNGGRSKRLGFSVSLEADISEGLAAGINLHYVDAKLLEQVNGAKVPGVSNKTAATWLNWNFKESWNWYLEANYRGERLQEGDLNNSQLPIGSYTLISTAVNWRFNKLTIGLRIDNLLDKEYIDYAQLSGFYPANGRHASIKLSYQF